MSLLIGLNILFLVNVLGVMDAISRKMQVCFRRIVVWRWRWRWFYFLLLLVLLLSVVVLVRCILSVVFRKQKKLNESQGRIS